MRPVNTSKRLASSRSRLVNGQLLVSGLSSYRATFSASLATLTTNDSRKLTDEQWLNYLASFLNNWFKYETQLPCCTEPPVSELLPDFGLESLTYDRFVAEMRPTVGALPDHLQAPGYLE